MFFIIVSNCFKRAKLRLFFQFCKSVLFGQLFVLFYVGWLRFFVFCNFCGNLLSCKSLTAIIFFFFSVRGCFFLSFFLSCKKIFVSLQNQIEYRLFMQNIDTKNITALFVARRMDNCVSVNILPPPPRNARNCLIVRYLHLFFDCVNNVLRRFYAVFGAKCKTTDARFTISTFVVSLRCAFVCSCASIALFLGKPFTMVCLSDGNNSIMYHNTELSGDTEAYFDRLYASVSFMYGSPRERTAFYLK